MNLTHTVSHRISRLCAVLATTAGVVLAGAAPRAFAQSESGFTYQGVAYTSYQATEYQLIPQGAQSAAAMEAVHVNYASVLATQFVQTATSTTIAPNGSSPTDAAVEAAIANLQGQGIKVVLKPQVDSLDGNWRGTFAPTDTAAWFASYQTFIVHYAQIAQAHNVDIFVIGCEFATLSGSAYQANWDAIITAVKAVYTGPITYAANATGAGDEFTTVSFWDKLDLLGVDGYFPLTNHADPTLTELKNAWTIPADNKNNFAPATALQNFQASHPTMPLIFTEIGYLSVSGTNEEPYNYSHAGSYDPTEQQNCYEAFFEVFSQQTTWVKGVFWWDWTVSPPGANDLGYSPQNKPAGDTTLALWYGPAIGPSFTLSPSAPTLTVVQGDNATSTISVADVGGFSGAVTLSASGLPSGVTAAFATNPTTGSSLLTLTASFTATLGGPVTVTIHGNSGALTASTTIALTVNVPPSFTIAPSPSSLTVPQGSSETSIFTVTPAGGFTGAVTYSVSVLPSGVTEAVNPVPGAPIVAGQTALMFTATSTATLGGPVTVIVTGTSGRLSASTTIALTVIVPPPGVTLSGTAVTLKAGATTGNTSTITVTPTLGFTGSVTLTAAVTASPAGAVHLPTFSFGMTSPVSLTSAAAGTATLTISTTASTTGACTAAVPMQRGIPWYAGGGAALACILLFGIPARRRNWRNLLGMLLLLVALAGGLAACGGGGSSGGGGTCPGPVIPGTTAGAYTVTVTATSGAVTATAPVTLTVQ